MNRKKRILKIVHPNRFDMGSRDGVSYYDILNEFTPIEPVTQKINYGYLYSGLVLDNPTGLFKSGWRVASMDDWNELLNYLVNSDKYSSFINLLNVGYYLKSKNTVDINSPWSFGVDIHPRWEYLEEKTGLDMFNFGIQPNGVFELSGKFSYLGERSYIWSSNNFIIPKYVENQSYSFKIVTGYYEEFLTGTCYISSNKIDISTRDGEGNSITNWLFSLKSGDFLKFHKNDEPNKYYIGLINNVLIGEHNYSFDYEIISGGPFEEYEQNDGIIISDVTYNEETKKEVLLLKNDEGEVYTSFTLKDFLYEYSEGPTSAPSGELNINELENSLIISKKSFEDEFDLNLSELVRQNETVFKIEKNGEDDVVLFGKIISYTESTNTFTVYYDFIDTSTVRKFEDNDLLSFSVLNTCDNNSALAVRGVRNATIDELSLEDGEFCEDYIGNDGKKYKTIKINDMVWMSENLSESRYINNTNIEKFTKISVIHNFSEYNLNNNDYNLWEDKGYSVGDFVQHRGYEYELIRVLTRQEREIPPNINSAWNLVTPLNTNRFRFVNLSNDQFHAIIVNTNTLNKDVSSFLSQFRVGNYIKINTPTHFYYSRIIRIERFGDDYIFETEKPIYSIVNFANDEECEISRFIPNISFRMSYNNQDSYSYYPETTINKYDNLTMGGFFNMDDVQFGNRVKELTKKHISLPINRSIIINTRLE